MRCCMLLPLHAAAATRCCRCTLLCSPAAHADVSDSRPCLHAPVFTLPSSRSLLPVEGHTSADLGDARHNSMLRASSTKEAIGSALLKMEGHDRGVKKLKAVGHGASKPLAGLDDGGNHSANRRVEIHITEEIEEEEVDEEAVESAVEAEMRGRIEEIRGGKQTEAAQSKRGTCLGCVLM